MSQVHNALRRAWDAFGPYPTTQQVARCGAMRVEDAYRGLRRLILTGEVQRRHLARNHGLTSWEQGTTQTNGGRR